MNNLILKYFLLSILISILILLNCSQYSSQNTISPDEYPNPYSPPSNPFIEYTLEDTVPVLFIIYNTEGEVVDTLVNEIQPKGEHKVDCSHLEGGIYFYRIILPEDTIKKKIVFMW